MATCREGHVSLMGTGWWTQLTTDYSGSRQQGAVKKNHLLLYGELAFSLCELAIPPPSKWTDFACFFLHLEMSDQAVFSDLSLCQTNGEEAEGDAELRTCAHWALWSVWEEGNCATWSDGGCGGVLWSLAFLILQQDVKNGTANPGETSSEWICSCRINPGWSLWVLNPLLEFGAAEVEHWTLWSWLFALWVTSRFPPTRQWFFSPGGLLLHPALPCCSSAGRWGKSKAHMQLRGTAETFRDRMGFWHHW